MSNCNFEALDEDVLLNSLNIFGAVVFKQVVNNPESVIQIFDQHYCAFNNLPPSTDLNKYTGKLSQYSQVIERDPALANILNNLYLDKIKKLFAKDFLFWGSDFSTFRSSSGWHRDQSSSLPFFKVLLYLSNSFGNDQSFNYFPGSHHCEDRYSRQLSAVTDWPLTKNLVKPNLKKLNEFSTEAGIANFATIHINPGDLIIFDSRLLHSVSATHDLRRLISISFIANRNKLLSSGSIQYFYSDILALRSCLENQESFDDYDCFLILYRIAWKIVESKLHKQDIPYSHNSFPDGAHLGAFSSPVKLSISNLDKINKIIFNNSFEKGLRYIYQFDI